MKIGNWVLATSASNQSLLDPSYNEGMDHPGISMDTEATEAVPYFNWDTPLTNAELLEANYQEAAGTSILNHLAVRAGPIPLSRTLGYVQARFGQGYNRRHGSSGPRWQSRYKARLVESPEYFDRLIAYVHLNPVEAGIVDDPADYAFSGHRELPGKGI